MRSRMAKRTASRGTQVQTAVVPEHRLEHVMQDRAHRVTQVPAAAVAKMLAAAAGRTLAVAVTAGEESMRNQKVLAAPISF